MARYPSELIQLIAYLKKLPGVGARTAERFAFHLLNWKEGELAQFSGLLQGLKHTIVACAQCGCLTEAGVCAFCARETKALCIIASARDAYSIDETGAFRGVYHVLGSLLSPIDGRGTQSLRLEILKERVERLGIQEVIIALDSTLEGDTTALFLKEEMSQWGVAVLRLAFGIPLGSSLDFVDGGTLARALMGRQHF